jgi:hypothetical protein
VKSPNDLRSLVARGARADDDREAHALASTSAKRSASSAHFKSGACTRRRCASARRRSFRSAEAFALVFLRS